MQFTLDTLRFDGSSPATSKIAMSLPWDWHELSTPRVSLAVTSVSPELPTVLKNVSPLAEGKNCGVPKFESVAPEW